MWNECSCTVVWTSSGIVLLWDWNENWLFPVLWPLLSFSNFLTHWVKYFLTTSSFRIWNDSAGIPSPPLALFAVMLPKAHVTSYSGYLALDVWPYHCGFPGQMETHFSIHAWRSQWTLWKGKQIWHQKMRLPPAPQVRCYWEDGRVNTNSFRKNEMSGPKKKQHSAVDMAGGESKARYC